MKTGIELIAIERQEQIEKHGRTVELDALTNSDYELAQAARMLITNDEEMSTRDLLVALTGLKYWDQSILEKMDNKPYKEKLVIAGALIAAEIDRLNFIGA